jgi:hypothetical protein
MLKPDIHKRFKFEYINAGHSLSKEHVAWFKESIGSSQVIGLDTEFDFSKLGLIQLGTDKRVLLIQIRKNCQKTISLLKELIESKEIIKCGAGISCFINFIELWGDASLIYSNLGIHLNSGCDVTRIFNPSFSAKKSFSLEKTKKGLFRIYNEVYPHKDPLKKDSETTTSRWCTTLTSRQLEYAALDAYISYMVGLKAIKSRPGFDRINFNDLANLSLFTGFHKQLLDQESVSFKGSFSTSFSHVTLRKCGLMIDVLNDQFNNRLSFRDSVLVLFKNGKPRSGEVLIGRHGKGKTIRLPERAHPSWVVRKIIITESNDPYAWDTFSCDLYFSNYFSGIVSPQDSHLFNTMYSNSLVSGLENLFQDLSIESSIKSIDSLNKSQKQAVAASLDSSTAMNIVRGPPGTGKTTVIAKTVSIGIKNKLEYIITAQSNAATRNIADSLEKNGVVDYYIIVSDHFYVEVLLFNLSLVA